MKTRNIFTATVFCVAACLFTCGNAMAADHMDGPAATSDPAADITDVYAWMQDLEKINLIMNVFPLANGASQFSDSVSYVFNIRSLAGYGNETSRSRLVCEFSAAQRVTCRVGDTELISEASAGTTAGVLNSAGTFRIFTGLRNDPFFFDLTNFNTVRTTVRDVASSLEFDDAGCPTLDQATKDILVGTLTGGGGLEGANSPPADFFGPLNVLSIVIQADKSLFGPGPLYSVSAATFRN